MVVCAVYIDCIIIPVSHPDSSEAEVEALQVELQHLPLDRVLQCNQLSSLLLARLTSHRLGRVSLREQKAGRAGKWVVGGDRALVC